MKSAGLRTGHEVVPQDASEVVLPPDRDAAVVDDLFAEEVGAPEVAVVIRPVAVEGLQVVRAESVGQEDSPVTGIRGRLGAHHELLQAREIKSIHGRISGR